MYNDKIYLNPKDILEQDFKIDARGYRPQEVDKYLDLVIRDYTEFGKIIKGLEQEIKVLTEDNSTLKSELRRLQEELVTAKEEASSEKAVTNIDLLKRISQLEKVVFGKNE